MNKSTNFKSSGGLMYSMGLQLITLDQRVEFASLVAQMVKNPPEMQKAWVRSLGWEDSLKESMATHSSILAWKIPQRSLVGYSPQGRKVSDTTEATEHAYTYFPNCFQITEAVFQLEIFLGKTNKEQMC